MLTTGFKHKKSVQKFTKGGKVGSDSNIEILQKGIDSGLLSEEIVAKMKAKIAELNQSISATTNVATKSKTDLVIEKYNGSGLNEKEALTIDVAYDAGKGKNLTGFRLADVKKVMPLLLKKKLIHLDTLKHTGVITLTKEGKDLAEKYNVSVSNGKGTIQSIHERTIIAHKNGDRATYFIDPNKDGTKRIVRSTGSVKMPFGANSTKDINGWIKENFDSIEELGTPINSDQSTFDAIELLKDLLPDKDAEEAIEMLKDLLGEDAKFERGGIIYDGNKEYLKLDKKYNQYLKKLKVAQDKKDDALEEKIKLKLHDINEEQSKYIEHFKKGGKIGSYDEEKYPSYRSYIIKLVSEYLGDKRVERASADWGGIPVWNVKNDGFNGYFVIVDDNDSVILMTREFNEETDENDNEDIMESDDEKGIRKLLEKAVSIKEGEEEDLFEKYDELPEEVQEVLNKYSEEENDYPVLEKMLKELNHLGYTFEYGLDAEPYNLRKI